MTEPDTVTDFDLLAYIDGQLDPQRRFEVEDHLARNPEVAAWAMAEMRARDAIRLLAAEPMPPPPPGQVEAAARLRAGLRRSGRAQHVWRVAAAAALVLLGAVLGRLVRVGESSPQAAASEFVAEAVMAHRTSAMRAAMRSQPEAAVYNPLEIRTATRIVLPQLPASWRVTDVQVFPSADGPTVAMALETQGLGNISLFAAPAPEFADREPDVMQSGRRAVAYWQIGQVAYALTGAAPPQELQHAAARLSEALNGRPGASRVVPLGSPRPIAQ